MFIKLSEAFTERMDKAMRKGFISIMILRILEINPSYGYKIGKEIEERTESLWIPPASTMYTLLNELKKKGLIRVMKEIKEERGKKIYEITDKGRNTLTLIMEKYKKMRNVIFNFLLSTIKDKDFQILRDIVDLDPFNIFFKSREGLSKKEKIEFLKTERNRILDLKKLANSQINKIDKTISKLTNEQKGG